MLYSGKEKNLYDELIKYHTEMILRFNAVINDIPW